jgi:hypothetical protein
MSGELVGRKRGTLAIAATIGIAAILVTAAWLVHDRRNERAHQREQLLATEAELEACLVGRGVRDTDVRGALVLRELDGRAADPSLCSARAHAAIEDLDPDALRDADHALAFAIGEHAPYGDTEREAMCEQIRDLRAAVAAVTGGAAPSIACTSPESGARPYEPAGHEVARVRHGELLDTMIDDDNRLTLRRLRPDGSVAAELSPSDWYAADGDDVVYVSFPSARLERWRAGAVQDGPTLGDRFGHVRAWRGGVGVFWSKEDAFLVQRFDDALAPVGAPRRLAYPDRDADVAIGPDGAVTLVEGVSRGGLPHRVEAALAPGAPAAVTRDTELAPSAAGDAACVADRAVWSVISDHVAVATIGQMFATVADVPTTPLDLACTDDRLFVAGEHGYAICDRTRCTPARPLRGRVHAAAVRAVGQGAEALFDVSLGGGDLLLVVRDPRGDGHVTVDDFAHVGSAGAIAYDGHWFVLRAAQP